MPFCASRSVSAVSFAEAKLCSDWAESRAAGRGGARVFSAGAPVETTLRGRETAQTADGLENNDFFAQLASHWKKHYAGWSAWLLTPDLKLPGKMRFKESRRVPMWNGPIECRLFRFDLLAGSARNPAAAVPAATDPAA